MAHIMTCGPGLTESRLRVCSGSSRASNLKADRVDVSVHILRPER